MYRSRLFALCVILSVGLVATATESDLLIADFEWETWEGSGWTVTGQAFGPGPARGTLPNQMNVTGFKGERLVNSFYGGDRSTGTLTSSQFVIARKYINFLIGGGGHAGRTCMNLLVDGRIVRTATGPNTEPGGSEHLDWHSWDVTDLIGKTARLQILDDYTGGWGHINVDHVYQSNERRQLMPKTREFAIQHKYLNFPVKNAAGKRLVHLLVDGQCVREFDIQLAPDEPDFWVFMDVSEYSGNVVQLKIDRHDPRWNMGFDAVFQADTFPGQEHLYQERLRPQFHFSSRRGWNNDTNGMVYYDGEYHLFYQHNPYGWDWGNMSWGHAVSTNLVHWTELPVALHPDELGTIFSGSAVVDERNTAGFQTGDEKVLVAIYTSAGGTNPMSQGQPFTQSIAYSNDRGRTWAKYEGNPVIGPIKGGTRDPKVIWHEPTGRWVMVLWIDGRTLSFFTSDDLKTWERHSDVEGFYECPELFELPVDGDPSKTKWVVYGANGDYLVGDFDGTRFTQDGDLIQYQYGNCFYASQVFNNMPEEDGRRIQMAWGRVAMPDMPFNQMILFPVSLTLRSTEDGIRMFAEPVREIEKLHKQHHQWRNLAIAPGHIHLETIDDELLHIRAEVDVRDVRSFSLVVRDVPIVYNAVNHQLTCIDRTAPLQPVNGKIILELLVDRMSVEIFANEGRVYMPIGQNMVDRPKTLAFASQGGTAVVNALDLYTLKSTWPQP